MHGGHWDFGGRGGPFGGRRGPFGGPGSGGPVERLRRARPDFSDFFGGPPPRADRGVVRYLVLDAIARQPRHGYEIIQAIEERSSGTYRPSPGVVYPTLQMLEEMGHAKLEETEARKVYAITAEGKQDLKAHSDEVEDFYADAGEGSWEDFADELRDLTHRVGKMFKSIGRSARRGRLTPSTMKKLRVVLDEAIVKIEAIIDPEDRD
jgi:DNA-binding PadR family transcriptional regulator